MRLDEARLRRLMHELTPEPPRLLTGRDITDLALAPGKSRGPRHAFVHRWTLAALAACVALLVGVGGAVLTERSTDRGHPGAAGTGASQVSSVATPPRTTVTTPGPSLTTSTPVGPWQAEPLVAGSFSGVFATGDSLYAVRGGNTIQRLSTDDGHVIAQGPAFAEPAQPVSAGSLIWAVSNISVAGDATVVGLDPSSLQPVSTVSANLDGLTTPIVAITAGPNTVYVGGGSTVVRIDAETATIKGRLSISGGGVTALAASPDESQLYVAVAGEPPTVRAIDPITGEIRSEVQIPDGVVASGSGLVASSGGVWETISTGGHTERVTFASSKDLSNGKTVSSAGGGGYSMSVSFGGGAAWIGGYTLVCADPNTGDVRASTPSTSDASNQYFLAPVSIVGSQAFGVVDDLQGTSFSGVVRLEPPAGCEG